MKNLWILPLAAGILSTPFALGEPAPPRANAGISQLANDTLRITYDPGTGLVQCDHPARAMSLRDITSAVTTEAAGVLTSVDSRYVRTHATSAFTDNLGSGHDLTILCTDTRNTADLEIQIRLYDTPAPARFAIKTTLHNRSAKDLGVIELQPLRAAAIHIGGDPADYTISTEGNQMSDEGTLARLAAHPAIGSWLNILLLDQKTRNTLHAGFITCETSESYFMLKKKAAPGGEVTLETHCPLLMPSETRQWGPKCLTPWNNLSEIGCGKACPVLVRPDTSLSSDVLMLSFGSDPHDALIRYAAALNKYNQFRPPLPAAQGWCGWPYYYWAMDENDLLATAGFVAKNLRDYGMEYIQVDGGWQIKAGEWEADPRVFPSGMKSFSDQIHALGLKSGIWINPFEIDETSDIAKNHPDRLIKKRDGTLQTFGKAHSKPPKYLSLRPDGAKPNVHVLDITHPAARVWLRDLFKKITRDWGYDLVKIDWAYSTYAIAESFSDPTVTKVQAYRMFLRTIREGIGEDRYLLNCAPYTGVGIVDASRISSDSAANTRNLVKPNGQARALARRFYQNNTFWRNDPDMFMVRPPLTPAQEKAIAQKRKEIDKRLATGGFTLAQARAAASLVAMSGAQLFNGDNLLDLPPDRLDIIKKTFPAHHESATPIDLFENTHPSIYNWRFEKKFAGWNILGLYNWTSAPLTNRVDFERLGLDPAKTYLCYDFWNDRFLGEKRGEISMPLDSMDCAIISIHEKKITPQVISTSRHITQGCPDLLDVTWNPAKNTLSGASKVIPGATYEIVIYVPNEFTFASYDSTAPKTNIHQPVGGPIIKLLTTPQKTDHLEWSVSFTKTPSQQFP